MVIQYTWCVLCLIVKQCKHGVGMFLRFQMTFNSRFCDHESCRYCIAHTHTHNLTWFSIFETFLFYIISTYTSSLNVLKIKQIFRFDRNLSQNYSYKMLHTKPSKCFLLILSQLSFFLYNLKTSSLITILMIYIDMF